MELNDHVEKIESRLAELETELEDPKIYGDQKKYRELTREYNRVKQLVVLGREYRKLGIEIEKNQSLLELEAEDSELTPLVREEIAGLTNSRDEVTKELRIGILPPDPADSRNTILEIRAGAGGSESALFAADLYRMFERYAERRKWDIEVLDSSSSDLKGFREIVFMIRGDDVFRRLKYESGVHRVQRVPVTEAQGRVHTSTATVAVLPEAQEVDVEIRPEDIEVSVCRASGPGGQGVNTTDSAVQIQHRESGLIVRCADGRSQQQNKVKALTILRSRLLERKKAEEEARYAAQRKAQVGAGERNERIRTYNFPQNRVTDHRIDLTLYNLSELLAGDLDTVIDPLMAHDLEERLVEAIS